jgi:DNA-binding response OmpR family regulator
VVGEGLDLGRGIRPYLAAAGYEVRFAPIGEVLSRIGAHQPDLIIFEVGVQSVPVLELCRQVRADPANDRTPVMFLSVDVSPAGAQAGAEAGCDLYVPRHTSPRRLINLVDMLLSSDTPLLKRFRAESAAESH